MSARLRRVLLTGAAVVVLALVGWYIVRPLVPRPVAMPPRDASPQTVVRTWLRAVNHNDSGTARALMVREARYEVKPWIAEVRTIDNVRPARVETAEGSATVVMSYDLHYSGSHPHFPESDPGDTFELVLVEGRWLLTAGPNDGL